MEGASKTETATEPKSRTWAGTTFEFARNAFDVLAVPNRRNLLHWLSWAVALAILLSLTAVLSGGRIYGWEQEVTREFQAWDNPGLVSRVTSSRLLDPLTWPGGLLMATAIIGLLLLKHRVEAALVALILPLHILGNFPKVVVDRERPSGMVDDILGVGGGMSFPSGHTMYAVTFFGFLTFVALARLNGRVRRAGIALLWLGFVILVGYGRIAGGHHWPLDVLTSYVVGIGLLSGLIWLLSGLRRARGLRAKEDGPAMAPHT